MLRDLADQRDVFLFISLLFLTLIQRGRRSTRTICQGELIVNNIGNLSPICEAPDREQPFDTSLSIRCLWGKRGKMEAKTENLLSPTPLGRPDTQAI